MACLCLLLSLAWTPLAHARRAALIIGNASYINAAALANTMGDARRVAEAAQRAGFSVTLATDLTKDGFNQALRQFRDQADGAEVAMIYYAGHGIEGGGKNWLLPTDVKLGDPRDLSLEALELNTILSTLEGAHLRIVALDACRENPFGNSWRSGTRAVSKGLAETEIDGALVIYAAAGGQLALDTVGSGTGSPFAEALAKRLPEPGLSIHRLGPSIRDDVKEVTGGKQVPWMSVSIGSEEISLVPKPEAPAPMAPAPAAPVAAPSPMMNESLLWAGADLAGTAESYQGYLEAFPQGQFANLARIKLDRLRAPAPAPQVAVIPAAPPAQPAYVAPAPKPAPAPAASQPAPPAYVAPAPKPAPASPAPAAPQPVQPTYVAPPAPVPAPAPPQIVALPPIQPAPQPGTVSYMGALRNPRDGKPLPMIPGAPRLSTAGYPVCRESYQAIVGPLEKIGAINSCIVELGRFSETVLNGFAKDMIRHQDFISRLYSDQVGAKPEYTPESQNWFYAEVMKEHAASNPGGANYADYTASKHKLDEDIAYLRDRYCFWSGTCGGYAPPPGVGVAPPLAPQPGTR